MKKLFVDLETIAANDGQILEEIIRKINYKASSDYLRSIIDLYENELIDDTEYQIFLDEHYDQKDRVLEEIDDVYKSRIDYKKVYTVNESNNSMIESIRSFAQSIETYIIFYYNTERELREKEKICAEIFPKCQNIGIKFYLEPYNKEMKRTRTNKAEYIKNILNLENLENCMLIDRSIRSCDEWVALNGETFTTHKKINYLEDSADSVLKIVR